MSGANISVSWDSVPSTQSHTSPSVPRYNRTAYMGLDRRDMVHLV